jgi:CTP:molybdopterin cytidylyltransferase MocA
MEVTGLVLAAGAGRRYGMPKALVPWHGRLLVQHAAGTLAAAGCTDVVVVLGAAADRVRAAAPDLPRTVENPDWATGLASSLRAGLAALAGSPAEAAVVLLVDMPGVTPSAVRRVVAFAGTGVLAIAGYGTPVPANAGVIRSCSAATTGPGWPPPRPATAAPATTCTPTTTWFGSSRSATSRTTTTSTSPLEIEKNARNLHLARPSQ